MGTPIVRQYLKRRPEDAALEAQIQSLETAFHMQSEASEAFDLRREPEGLRTTYGSKWVRARGWILTLLSGRPLRRLTYRRARKR